MDFPIDQISFWILVIPGFILVWSYRYFSDSEKKIDFEFLGLALVWGLINIIFMGFLSKIGFKLPDGDLKDLGVLWGSALSFSMFPFIFGLLGAQISKYDWFRRIIKKLKSKWFNGKSN